MRADSSIEKFYSKKVVFVATAKWVMNVVFAIVVFAELGISLFEIAQSLFALERYKDKRAP